MKKQAKLSKGETAAQEDGGEKEGSQESGSESEDKEQLDELREKALQSLRRQSDPSA